MSYIQFLSVTEIVLRYSDHVFGYYVHTPIIACYILQKLSKLDPYLSSYNVSFSDPLQMDTKILSSPDVFRPTQLSLGNRLKY
jgi:hypothetical protein